MWNFQFYIWSIFFKVISIGKLFDRRILKANIIPENDLLLIAYIVSWVHGRVLYQEGRLIWNLSHILCLFCPVWNCRKHRFSRVCRWEITFVRCLSLTFFLNEKKWIIVYRSKDVGKLFNVRHITSWGWKRNETGRHLMVRINENYNRLMRNYMLIILFCVWIITEIWSSFKYFECMPSIEK